LHIFTREHAAARQGPRDWDLGPQSNMTPLDVAKIVKISDGHGDYGQ